MAWHKLKELKISGNIKIIHIPPYTPKMNTIEQIWKQIRSMGFKNELFHLLVDVVDVLLETINTKEKIKNITRMN